MYALRLTDVESLVKSGNDVTRFESFFKIAPNLDVLQPFGSTAWVHVPKVLRAKLEDKAVKGVLVGYEPTFALALIAS